MDPKDNTPDLGKIIKQSWDRCEHFGLQQTDSPNVVQFVRR